MIDSRGNQGASDSMASPKATSFLVTSESDKRADERSRQPSGASFGAFYKLPAELRLIIWQNLMPELREECEPSLEAYGSPVYESPRSGNRLAVTRTSFALAYEVQSELYRSRTLHISIRPQRRGWRAEGLPGSTMADFARATFSFFESIKVEILCPSRFDPGQLMYARAAVLGLVRVLRGYRSAVEHCEPYSTRDDQRLIKPPINRDSDETSTACVAIPRLHIEFLDNGLATWHDDSLAYATFGKVPYFDDDLELLAAPFGYLRNVEHISFTFPEQLRPSARLLELVQYIRKETSEPCLSTRTWSYPCSPIQEFLQLEAQRYLALDLALDTAPGPAAAILRRERLIHWRWYWRTLGHLKENDMYLFSFISHRFPEQLRDFEQLEPSFRDYGWKLEHKKDPQWLEEWRCRWPDGIPPRGSLAWFSVIAAATQR